MQINSNIPSVYHITAGTLFSTVSFTYHDAMAAITCNDTYHTRYEFLKRYLDYEQQMPDK